jgi:hypothetical protein
MKSKILKLALAMLLGGGATADGQEKQSGTWTGRMSPPNLASAPATYDVEMVDEELSIQVHQPGGVIPTEDAEFNGTTIKFVMVGPGMRLSCELNKMEDDTFGGDCENPASPAGSPKGRLTMVPPEG